MNTVKYNVAVDMFKRYCEFWTKELNSLKLLQELHLGNYHKSRGREATKIKKGIEDMTAYVESSHGYGIKRELTEAYNLTVEMIGENGRVDELFKNVCEKIENFPKL